MASALVIEDGTGVPLADSYISIADADIYAALFGLDTWVAKTEAQKDVLLRKATQYVDQHYLNRWKGSRTFTTQVLQWPRQYVQQFEDNAPRGNSDNFYEIVTYIDKNTIPVELKNAVVEAAVKFIEYDITQDEGRRTQSESVGTLSVTYALNSKDKTIHTRIEMILSSLLNSSNTTTLYRG